MASAYVSLRIDVGERNITGSIREICRELNSEGAVKGYDAAEGHIYANDSEAASIHSRGDYGTLITMLSRLEKDGFAYFMSYHPESPEESAFAQSWAPGMDSVFTYPLLNDGSAAITDLELGIELGKPVSAATDAELGQALRSFWKKTGQ